MSERNIQPRNPEEPDTYTVDLDKARRMAKAEKPFRDQSIELREIGKEILELQLSDDRPIYVGLSTQELEDVLEGKSDIVAEKAKKVMDNNDNLADIVETLASEAEGSLEAAKIQGVNAGRDYEDIRSRQYRIDQIR